MEVGPALQGGLYLFITLAVAAYISYMIGLYAVLKRLDATAWHAFIPIYNFYALVRAVGAPTLWFFLSFLPYIGVAYAGSVAIRLGAIFGKDAKFSLFWLTFGAFWGMPIIARSETFNVELRDRPLRLLDVRKIKQRQKEDKKTPPDFV